MSNGGEKGEKYKERRRDVLLRGFQIRADRERATRKEVAQSDGGLLGFRDGMGLTSSARRAVPLEVWVRARRMQVYCIGSVIL